MRDAVIETIIDVHGRTLLRVINSVDKSLSQRGYLKPVRVPVCALRSRDRAHSERPHATFNDSRHSGPTF